MACLQVRNVTRRGLQTSSPDQLGDRALRAAGPKGSSVPGSAAATQTVYLPVALIEGYPYWDCMWDSGRISIHGQERQPGGGWSCLPGRCRLTPSRSAGWPGPDEGGAGAWPSAEIRRPESTAGIQASGAEPLPTRRPAPAIRSCGVSPLATRANLGEGSIRYSAVHGGRAAYSSAPASGSPAGKQFERAFSA